MQRDTTPFIDLPSDILLRVFSECDVFDILRLSSTCKRLQQTADEHQTWFRQAKRLQIPVSYEAISSKVELKDLVISRAKVDACWIRGRPGYLMLHEFDLDVAFVSSHYLPGGKFVVLLYETGSIDLKKIQDTDVSRWNLVDVARYEQQNVADSPAHWSGLLTETSYGCPALAYMNGSCDKLFVFLIDHISQTIEEKQVVEIRNLSYWDVWDILAAGNKIFCCREEWDGWGILVVQLDGPNTIQKHFILYNLEVFMDAWSSMGQFFSISENSVVVCQPDGIRLYHIPELESVEDSSTLFPVWSWSGEFSQSDGSLYDMGPQHPKLYIQGSLTTHKLDLGLDKSGFMVVLKHDTTGGPPAYWLPGWGRNLVLKGRKGVCHYRTDGGKVIAFNTLLLGREDTTGVFRICANERELVGDRTQVDLDEVTGRLLVVIGVARGHVRPYTRRLWLADTSV